MSRCIEIVITDDDPEDHQMFRHALKQIGSLTCNITSYYHGQQLIEHLEKTLRNEKGDLKLPDLIVLDLIMPFLDGLGTLKKIKDIEGLRQIPVFIITEIVRKEDRERSLLMGCAGIYAKPTRAEELPKLFTTLIEHTGVAL